MAKVRAVLDGMPMPDYANDFPDIRGLPCGNKEYVVRVDPAKVPKGSELRADLRLRFPGTISRLKAAGLWDDWYVTTSKPQRVETRHGAYFRSEYDQPRSWVQSSVGPLRLGFRTFERAPFQSLPLVWNVQAETYRIVDVGRGHSTYNAAWWHEHIAKVQCRHMPWAKERELNALYYQDLGFVARAPKGWSGEWIGADDEASWVSRFCKDSRATADRDDWVNAEGTSLHAEFRREVGKCWSVLAFCYRRDTLAAKGHWQDTMSGARLWQTIPQSPEMFSESFSTADYPLIPTIDDLVRYSSKEYAFQRFYDGGFYDVWGSSFAEADYIEMIDGFNFDSVLFPLSGFFDIWKGGSGPLSLDGERELSAGEGFSRFQIVRDDWVSLQEANTWAMRTSWISFAVYAVQAIVYAYIGKYGTAAKSAVEAGKLAQAGLENAANNDPSAMARMVFKRPNVFIRSLPRDTDFYLMTDWGDGEKVEKRLTDALKHIEVMLKFPLEHRAQAVSVLWEAAQAMKAAERELVVEQTQAQQKRLLPLPTMATATTSNVAVYTAVAAVVGLAAFAAFKPKTAKAKFSKARSTALRLKRKVVN
jgi:hypothetical protein